MADAPAGTVDLPGFGHIKKGYALAGAGVLLVIVVVWYRQRQSAQAATAAATAATDAVTSDTSATDIDPATGYPYGSAEDQAALEAQSSYTGDSSYLGDYYGYSGDGSYGGSIPAPTEGFTTNGEWSQAAEQYMLNSDPNASADSIAAALGKYIAGSPVTSTQQTIVQEAIAFEGYPPVNGPNGYPPSVNVQATGTPPPTSKTTGGYEAYAPGGKRLDQLTVPGVTYQDLAAKNPGVAKKYMGKPLPKGTAYYVPKETVS